MKHFDTGICAFGQTSAKCIAPSSPSLWGHVLYGTRVMLSIRGHMHVLGRAFDHDGTVLDILVQSRGNEKAAKRFFRTLLKGLHYVARIITTDTLTSSGAAKREISPAGEHRQHQGLNKRAENSHLPPPHATA